MQTVFADVIEKVQQLSIEEKEALKFLLDKYLIEGRREEIFKNYKKSLKEYREGKLEFSTDLNRLKEILSE